MQRICTGTITITSKKEGYVRVPELETEGSVLVSHDDLNCALQSDSVEVEIIGKKNDGQLYGKVLRVLERGKQAYAGVIEQDNGMFFFVPQEKRMYTDVIIPHNSLFGASPGSKVVIRITAWSDPKKSPFGEVVAVLGRPGDNNAEMLAYALERGFSPEHNEQVHAEAKAISEKGITEEDIKGRRDFRKIFTCTIDPADAKDFDDALSYIELPNGNVEIGIHIADVSHYVTPGSALDQEAIARETSVYLVDRCIPMLPEVLSNDLCSLVEGKDRLVMSSVFEMNDEGEVLSEWYGKSVICSAKRFTYEEAQKCIDNGTGPFTPTLLRMMAISKKLYAGRFKAGALTLDSQEVKFKLDDKGVPIDVYVKERIDTMRMIEEYMLLANCRVSKFVTHEEEKVRGEGRALCVYRIHPEPSYEKMHKLSLYIRQLGYTVPLVDSVIPSSALNQLLIDVAGKPEKELLQVQITRSMEKAMYSTKNVGHYGLAFTFYSHFTSPIRRYPDVLLHRLLTRVLAHDIPDEKERAYYDSLCSLASKREKEAADAERGSVKYKQVEYMSYRIGQEFDGVVSGVTDGGVFVEEKKSKSEGMIRMRDLGNDFFVYDREKERVHGERTGKEYKIGTPVKIKVKNADLALRIIDYVLVA